MLPRHEGNTSTNGSKVEKIQNCENAETIALLQVTDVPTQLMHAIMNFRASQEFRPLENVESKILLRDLLIETDPERYRYHIQRCRTYIMLICKLVNIFT